ncbi:MAG: hypothetical protein WCR19_01935, partial [Acholeplasmataceae bacterium]
MKKIILCIGIFMILVYLSSCDYNDYTDEIMLIKEELILKIPLEINSDFVFPVFEDYDITWAVNDIIYNDVYDYQTPITDTDILMEITIKKGISSITFNHSVKLLNRAFSSYQTEIYIELDESIDDINKDTYFDMQTTIYSEINGQEQNILNLESGGIRGRGNSTWGVYPKKPYKLKFDQRVSILGMPNAKE